VDTGVFGIERLVAMLPDGGPPTWEAAAPGPLVTALLRQLLPGGVHDVATPDGHLAILAKMLAPEQTATAWAGEPDHAARIRRNARLNGVDIDVADVAAFAAGESACLVILRSPAHLPVALAGNPPAILLLNAEADAPGYSAVRLDAGGRRQQTGPAAVTLLVREAEVDITLESLAAGAEALAQRGDQGMVPAELANRAVDSALRLVEMQQRQVDRARDQMRTARDTCDAMRQSRSWRVTGFLRRLKRR